MDASARSGDHGDLEAARPLLRERGLASAGKRAGRATPKGRRLPPRHGLGSMVGSGARPSRSRGTRSSRPSKDVLDAAPRPGRPSRSSRNGWSWSPKLGENIVVTGAARYEAGDGEGPRRLHPPAREQDRRARQAGGRNAGAGPRLAMHIATFAAPEWARRGCRRDRRRRAGDLRELRGVQSKPEAAREKIVDGMLAKRFFAASGPAVSSPSSRGSTTPNDRRAGTRRRARAAGVQSRLRSAASDLSRSPPPRRHARRRRRSGASCSSSRVRA